MVHHATWFGILLLFGLALSGIVVLIVGVTALARRGRRPGNHHHHGDDRPMEQPAMHTRTHMRHHRRARHHAPPGAPAVPPAAVHVPPPPPLEHAGGRREADINIFQLILFVLFTPIFMLIWAIQCLPHLLKATGALVEVIVDLIGGVTMGLATVVSDDPAYRQRLARFRQELLADANRLGRHLRKPFIVLADYAGLKGLRRRVGRKWQRSLDVRPPAAVVPPPFSPAPPPVCPFADRYAILDRIPGAGSSAELFVVRRIEDGMAVGDKLLLKSFDLTRGAWLESLVRESEGMRLAKRVGLVVDYMMGDDYFYYVMPFYEGTTLSARVAELFRTRRSDESLDDAELRQGLVWVRQLLQEVARYHTQGLIHKDIKPENVILTAEGARLVDVGLVTQLSSAMTLTTHGTEYFRDPELVRMAVAGRKVNEVPAERFDLYSLGALLYFVVEGTFPATGPFSRYDRRVPYAVTAIANKAMSDFDKRYTSAADMLADLDELLGARHLDRVQPARLPSFAGRAPAGSVAMPAEVTGAADSGVATAEPPRKQTSRVGRAAFLGVVTMTVVGGALLATGGGTTTRHSGTFLESESFAPPPPVAAQPVLAASGSPLDALVADCREQMQSALALSPLTSSTNLRERPVLLMGEPLAALALDGRYHGATVSWEEIGGACPASAVAARSSVRGDPEAEVTTAFVALHDCLGDQTPLVIHATRDEGDPAQVIVTAYFYDQHVSDVRQMEGSF